MDTSSAGIAARIVDAIVSRFANENGIESSHLRESADELTPVEITRAVRALGSEVIA